MFTFRLHWIDLAILVTFKLMILTCILIFLVFFFNKLRYDKKLHKRKNGKIDSIEETQKRKGKLGWLVVFVKIKRM